MTDQRADSEGAGPKFEIGDDDLLVAMRYTLPQGTLKLLTRTRWKDGIDVDEPSEYIRDFVREIIRAISPPAQVGGVAQPYVNLLDRQAQKIKQLEDALGAAQTPLAALVREWREAQKAIDRTPLKEREHNTKPLQRLVAAHNALIKYIDEDMG